MKKCLFFFAAFLGAVLHGVAQSSPEGGNSVAVAIVYDTSGSMGESVRDGVGKMSPKYVIANRALTSVIARLQEAASAKDAPRKVFCSLVVFEGTGAREAVKFGELDSEQLTAWVKAFNTPSGATPLGEAIRTAGKSLLQSKSPHKHILVLTDGINTVGPTPAEILLKLRGEAEHKGSALSFYFVAFDVAAKIFDPVKKLGSMVVAAANEKELNAQLGFILEEKILLEAEDPPAKSEKTPVKK